MTVDEWNRHRSHQETLFPQRWPIYYKDYFVNISEDAFTKTEVSGGLHAQRNRPILEFPPTNQISKQHEQFKCVKPKDVSSYQNERSKVRTILCRFPAYKHVREKYGPLYAESITIQQMMEKADPQHDDQMFVELEKHMESTLTLARGMQSNHTSLISSIAPHLH